MANDQEKRTRSFVASHLKTAHPSEKRYPAGCMICQAWAWARETRSLSDSDIQTLLDEYKPIVEVLENE